MKKKPLIITSVISLIALISVPLTMDIMLYALPNVYNETYYGEMKDKIDLLKNKSNKRIILIGGSSVPFSVDSHYLKQYLPDYNPVNFGLYASLGTNMMLDIVSKYIRTDDIVIITPEISNQTLSMYYNGNEALKALENNKDLLFTLNNKLSQSILGAIPVFNSEKISYISKNNIPHPEDIYSHDSFNEYGDIKVNREGNILLGGVDYNNMINLNTSIIDKDFIKYLNSFNDKCLKKSAKCYFRFSPMNDASIINKNNLENLYNYLDESLHFEIMGDPYNAVLEKEYFYDTNYHLNTSGAIKWSKQLIKDIKLTLDDSTTTDIVELDKPDLINPSDDKDVNNEHVHYFTYTESGNNYFINGLSEQGKTSIKVTLPYRYNDKVITHFKDDLFMNSNIEEITIQSNIRMISDYSFKNSKIKKIIIDNDYPNTIAVGDHLLDGCTANIYVKKVNYTKYKTSYSWSKYSSRIKQL